MTRIARQRTRAYRSELREEQTEETRTRILDATIRVMATGLASLSVPAVAREAGVSVPTVYRHFRSKRQLLAALYPHAAHKAGADSIADPRSLDELRPMIRALVASLDNLDDLSRAAMASPVASEVRHATMPTRLQRIRRLTDSIGKRHGEHNPDHEQALPQLHAARVRQPHAGSSNATAPTSAPMRR